MHTNSLTRSRTLALCSLFAGWLAAATAADNVILFIGDGMGPAHVKAGRATVTGSTGTALDFENLGVKGTCITTLPNGTITDSATAGTALATGYQHPANGVISMGANNSIKTTLLEIARDKGFKTGIITTDDIGGATPGAFGAHEPDRTLMADIRYDYLLEDTTYHHPASLPNILCGGGFNDPALVPGTAYTYTGLAQLLGYEFAGTGAAYLSATPASGRLLGLFGSSWAPMTGMAYRSGSSTQPTLSQMVGHAMELLQNPNGFFLMVESANIDKFSHSNDKNFVFEVAELNAAVQRALDWKAAHPSDNTLILVTADHETGGVSVPDQSIAAGTVPTMTWSSTGHTATQVPVFATWPAGLEGQVIDNTEVFNIVEDSLNYSTGGKPPVLTGLAVSAITETGATLQWNTVEPSSSEVLIDGRVLQDPQRTTAHLLSCSGLNPGTTYEAIAGSTDMGGFQGTATIRFTTKLINYDATVAAEPEVSIGAVTGTMLGALTPNDGVVQSVTEALSGAGSRLQVIYTLKAPGQVNDIDSLTVQGLVSWSEMDGAADSLVIEIQAMSPQGGYIWQPITLPFAASPLSSFIDSQGNLRIRFSDSASIRRERKDVLKVDYLVGKVTIGNQALVPPSAPNVQVAAVSGTSISLAWADSANETGYDIWRYSASSGWVLASTLAEGSTSFTDAGLNPGTSYSYVVRAFNAESYTDSDQVDVQTLTVLVAPANLKAAAGRGSITLTWTDSNQIETGYQVLRGSSADGNFSPLTTLGANATSFVDKVTRGTTCFYQVRAISGSDFGPVSTTVSATAK